MNWNEYKLRRRIDEQMWLLSKGVVSREQFLGLLSELEVEPPSDEQISIMFPTEMKNESVTVTPEGIDPSAARSLADEGDGSGVSTNGKRSSKVSV